MKKIVYYIITIFSITNYCYSQNPIIDLNQRDGTRLNGAYYKDVNNVLNPFEGTWLYVNGSTSLKIKLLKKENESNGKYSEDIIIGGYEYIENGILKANTLPESFPSSTFSSRYFINGNSFLYNNSYPPCNTCTPGEKRLHISLRDGGYYRNLILKREIINGQVQLKATLQPLTTVYYRYDEPEPEINLAIPHGEYTLIKQ